MINCKCDVKRVTFIKRCFAGFIDLTFKCINVVELHKIIKQT